MSLMSAGVLAIAVSIDPETPPFLILTWRLLKSIVVEGLFPTAGIIAHTDSWARKPDHLVSHKYG